MQEMINNIQGPGGISSGKSAKSKAVVNDPNAPSFKTTMKSFLKDVNSMQNHADESIEKMVAGEITDVHQVMLAVQEANLSFNLMMEIRSKMMDAYQELMRMQV